MTATLKRARSGHKQRAGMVETEPSGTGSPLTTADRLRCLLSRYRNTAQGTGSGANKLSSATLATTPASRR